ncbi:MAG: hypothetical protein R3234_00155 [Thermoanaerobaculia bacterium]|nr:hypothetical protein [Thermoanaerobaculia bacterium]
MSTARSRPDPEISGSSLLREWTLRILALMGAIVAGTVSLVLLSEWIQVAVLADPAQLQQYRFGSEGAVTHAGWHYRSASTYSGVCLLGAWLLSAIGGLFLLSWHRMSLRILGTAAGALLLIAATVRLLA